MQRAIENIDALKKFDLIKQPEVFVTYPTSTRLAIVLLQDQNVHLWLRHFEDIIENYDASKHRFHLNIYKQVFSDIKLAYRTVKDMQRNNINDPISNNNQFYKFAEKPVEALAFLIRLVRADQNKREELINSQHISSLRKLFIYLKKLPQQEPLKDFQLFSLPEYQDILMRITQQYKSKYYAHYPTIPVPQKNISQKLIESPYPIKSESNTAFEEKYNFLMQLLSLSTTYRKAVLFRQPPKNLEEMMWDLEHSYLSRPGKYIHIPQHPAYKNMIDEMHSTYSSIHRSNKNEEKQIPFLMDLLTKNSAERKSILSAQLQNDLNDLAKLANSISNYAPDSQLSQLYYATDPLIWAQVKKSIETTQRRKNDSNSASAAAVAPDQSKTLFDIDYTFQDIPQPTNEKILGRDFDTLSEKEKIHFLCELVALDSKQLDIFRPVLKKDLIPIAKEMDPKKSSISPDSFLQLLLLPNWDATCRHITSLCLPPDQRNLGLEEMQTLIAQEEASTAKDISLFFSPETIVILLTNTQTNKKERTLAPLKDAILYKIVTFFASPYNAPHREYKEFNANSKPKLKVNQHIAAAIPNLLVRRLAAFLSTDYNSDDELGAFFLQQFLADPNNINLFNCPLSGRRFKDASLAPNGETYESAWIKAYIQDNQQTPAPNSINVTNSSDVLTNTTILQLLMIQPIQQALTNKTAPALTAAAQKLIDDLYNVLDEYVAQPIGKNLPAKTKWKNINDAVQLIKAAQQPSSNPHYLHGETQKSIWDKIQAMKTALSTQLKANAALKKK